MTTSAIRVKGVAACLVVISATLATASSQSGSTRIDDPDGFYKRYPGSGEFMIVSAVGFDPARRRAMVHMAHSCGSLCGSGMHHFLEKHDATWREIRIPGVSICLWAS